MKEKIKNRKKMLEQVRKLAGSVKIPRKYKGMDLNKLIETAKMDYFKKYDHF